MIAGGAPIDCDHPFMAQKIQKHTNSVELAMVPLRAFTPSTPIMRFIVADTTRPEAMKRLMLELSARKPLMSLPTAYDQYRQAPMIPSWVALSRPASMSGCFITPIDRRHT